MKRRSRTKALPKRFRGAEVVRGLGMKSAAYDTLLEKKSMDHFDATAEMWIVLCDGSLDHDWNTQVKGFAKKSDAVRFACACANGNVDQRVLRVTAQVLVVATENSLDD